MPDYAALKEKIEELANRTWDPAPIAERIGRFVREGIPRKALDAEKLRASREKVLVRVQQRAEEYNYYLKNCAQSTALALMEEFGMGSMEIVKALTAFPGIGGTGEICGGVSGSLIALGLFYGPETPPDFEKTATIMETAQKFMNDFEAAVGYLCCADIIENIVMGRRINPGESDEAMGTYAEEKGFEKCCLLPGMGARIAAGYIIDNS